ncbi:uncharacterized protein AMSG_03548 [Thecamonas trahens ATCC 50062]|uniref:Rap-GAP domain-containing protein n=1 Tax=Thecamonas trahens ATCC 50062 TaxID=461836 RepID=A0A0L0D483_THETB|nr:hypothetical protein AMSG_03548 [Thecamonas trahens ATCC 50062]KNC47119.1 hypothetical protein AMSG_03548 [Thecamonas trahens ATCC 50062]|eukprot:XP_013759895.1 hypothetical protein AMSG_03548 [Thecamonas trahens ATCC 50062]
MALVYVHVGEATQVVAETAVALLANVRVGPLLQRTRARPVEANVTFGEAFVFALERGPMLNSADVSVEVLGLTSAPLSARASLALKSSSPLAAVASSEGRSASFSLDSGGSRRLTGSLGGPGPGAMVAVLGEIAIPLPRMGKLMRSSVWLGSVGGGMVSIAVKVIAVERGPSRELAGWNPPDTRHTSGTQHIPLLDEGRSGQAEPEYYDPRGAPLVTGTVTWARDVPTKRVYTKSDLFTAYVENPASESRWYARFFAGNVHDNFVAKSEAFRGSVVIVSTMLTTIPGLGNQYWVIVWSKDAIVRRIVSVASNTSLRFPELLQRVAPAIYARGYKLFSKVVYPAPGLEAALVSVENGDEPQLTMKIGVLFAKHGQTDENEMFSNRNGSEAFEEFLDLLGERVTLQGFKGYAAQLDTRNNGSGLTSVATSFGDHQIMFHVSTLLQYDPTDEQRIQRKRFIGNDIVVIVFMDGTTPYDVQTMKSQYTNVLVVVQPSPTDANAYLVTTANGPGIPPFGPEAAVEYPRDSDFVDWLLSKCINGQTATCAGAEFQIREKRTRAVLLDNIYNELPPSAFERKKKRMYEFASTGRQFLQALPVADPQIFQLFPMLDAFPHRISCFDSIDEILFFGTPAGVYKTAGNTSECHKVTDLAEVGQIALLPELNMLLILTSPPSARLYAFSLRELLADGPAGQPQVALVPVKSPLSFEVGVVARQRVVAVAVPDGAVQVFGMSATREFSPLVTLRTEGTLINAMAFTPTGLAVGYECALPDSAQAGAVEQLYLPYPMYTASALDAVPMDAFYLPGTGVFLCFQSFGVLVDALGAVILRIDWEIEPISFACFGTFLIVFSVGITQVRSLINGSLVESHLLMATSPFVCAGDTIFASVKGYDSWSVTMFTPVHKYPELLTSDPALRPGASAAESAAQAADAASKAAASAEAAAAADSASSPAGIDEEYSKLRRGRETTRMHRRSIVGLQQISPTAVLADDDDAVVHTSSLEAMWEASAREQASQVDAAAAAATASLEVEASRRKEARKSLAQVALSDFNFDDASGGESGGAGDAGGGSRADASGSASRSSGALATVGGMAFGANVDADALTGLERHLFRFGVCMNELVECIATKNKSIIIQGMSQVVNQVKIITRLVDASVPPPPAAMTAAASSIQQAAAVALRAGKRVMMTSSAEDWTAFARENLALTVTTHKLFRLLHKAE